jgi:hypothetical protein
MRSRFKESLMAHETRNAPASLRTMVVRETIISAVINSVLSALFFLLLFGTRGPVATAALGPDFLPQAFMISLMGTLIPGLLTAKRLGHRAKKPILIRAVATAFLSMVVAGGTAWLICHAIAPGSIDHVTALIVKIAFGAALSLVVTPVAVHAIIGTR